MPGRPRGVILIALGLSLLINVSIIVVASVLATQRRAPQDITAPVGVDLIELASPEPLAEEPRREAEQPTPQEKLDVTPDLFQPEITGGFGALDGAIAVDMGKLATTAIGEDFIFESHELDQAPRAVVRVPPIYPYAAREKGIVGQVQVRMLVNQDGSVGQVQILDARPKGVFEDAVRRTVPQWKFSPGKIEGRSVTAWVVTTVRFSLD